MKISEFCLLNGTSLKKNEGKEGYLYLDTANITNGVIDSFQKYGSYEELPSRARRKVSNNSIVYSTVRPNQQHFGIITEPPDNLIVSTGFCVIDVDEKIADPRYVYYYLSQSSITKKLHAIAEQATTAYPSIKAKDLGDLEIDLPDLDRQHEVAQILTSLDKKILLNSAINDNLQQQAEAAYSKLMDEAGNCTQVPLKDIAHITMGQSPAGHSCSENAAGTVFYQGRAEFGFRFPTRRLFTTEPKRMAKSGDVLLSVRAPVGDINIAYEECCIGRGLSAIESKTGESSFLLYTFRYFGRQFEVFNAEGTVFGSINKEQLNNFQIKLPPKEKIKEFEAIVRPMDDLIRMNFTENDRLTELREKLLLNFFNGK